MNFMLKNYCTLEKLYVQEFWMGNKIWKKKLIQNQSSEPQHTYIYDSVKRRVDKYFKDILKSMVFFFFKEKKKNKILSIHEYKWQNFLHLSKDVNFHGLYQ